MNTSPLRTALILLTTIPVCFADDANILANAGKFKPTVTLSDVYNEHVVTETDDGLVFRSVEIDPERIAFSVTANLSGVNPGVIDADTTVGISMGYFDHSAVLGDASDYNPNAKRATFRLTKEMERANGDTYEVNIGAVIYAWTEKQLTVTVTCTDIVEAGVNDIAASDYVGIADAGTSVLFEGDEAEVSVTFGDATGTRRLFLSGKASTVTKKFGPETSDDYEELDINSVNLKGEADVTGPEVKSTFSAIPSVTRTIDIAGTARDEHSIVTLDSITVNGVETTPADLGSEDGPEASWNWSVAGLPLAKGKNVVALTFSDQDGNVTQATKTYQADVKGPTVKSYFPIKPSLTNTIDIIGTADDITFVTLTAITVNGIATSPASLGANDTGNGIWNWSVNGLRLAKDKSGRSVVALTFSDDDGNLTKVTKTYTIK